MAPDLILVAEMASHLQQHRFLGCLQLADLGQTGAKAPPGGTGGFLGTGDLETTIRLKNLRMQGEHLVAPLATTAVDLEARARVRGGAV